MTNELVTSTSILLANLPQSNATDLSVLAPMRYLPQLAIASGTSKIVTVHKLARQGEFCAGKQTFGECINAVPLSYKNKAIWYNKKEKKHLAIMSLPGGVGDLDLIPEWVEFSEKMREVKDTIEYQTGVELLVYLTDADMFCSFLCKKTLTDAGVDLWRLAGREAKISSYFYEGKYNSWYKFNSAPTGEAAAGYPGIDNGNIILNTKKLKLAFDLFNKPDTLDEVAVDEEADTAFAR